MAAFRVTYSHHRPRLQLTLAAISDQGKHIADVETRLAEEVASNTALTQQVHDLATEIHNYLLSGKS